VSIDIEGLFTVDIEGSNFEIEVIYDIEVFDIEVDLPYRMLKLRYPSRGGKDPDCRRRSDSEGDGPWAGHPARMPWHPARGGCLIMPVMMTPRVDTTLYDELHHTSKYTVHNTSHTFLQGVSFLKRFFILDFYSANAWISL
jgi:hypothetical protein